MTLLIWLAASSLFWGGVLWLAGRALQRSPSVSGQARQWLWRSVTLLLVAPWIAAPLVIAFGLGLGSPYGAAAHTNLTAAGENALVALPSVSMTNAGAAVVENGNTAWAALGAMSLGEIVLMTLVAGWLVRFVAAQLALRSLLGVVMLSRKSKAGPAQDFVARWSERLKLRRAPQLRVVQEQYSPFSYGALRPTVYLPEGLEQRLSRPSLDLVVGHECVHVARRDGWLRPLERVCADILWFNPFAWLIRRELDVAREIAVDEAVVAMAGSRLAYARTLREVAGISAGLPAGAPVAAMSLGDGRNLMLRVSLTLSDAKRKPARAATLAACLLGLAAAPFAVAQVMLVIPAPPAPPAAPVDAADPLAHAVAPDAPEAVEAAAGVEGSEAAEPADAVEAPEAPQEPEAPPAAEIDTKTGMIRATFGSRVVTTSGNVANGYRVELLQTAPGETGETCVASLEGLGSLNVSKGQAVNAGDVVGRRREGIRMRLAVACSDQLDDQGRPVVQNAPEPPMPPEAALRIAPVAPPAPLAAPLAPLAALRPPVPAVSVAPAPMPAPAPAAAPRVFPVPAVSPAPPAPPAPPAQIAPVAPPQPPATPVVLDGAKAAVILAPARVSASYGVRVDPIDQRPAFHSGVDIAAPHGSAVHSPIAGRVVHAGARAAYGNTVTMQANDGVTLTFAQLDAIKVKAGDHLAAGAVIGTVGSSGRSTGPHLHMEVAHGGQTQDPESVAGLILIAGQ